MFYVHQIIDCRSKMVPFKFQVKGLSIIPDTAADPEEEAVAAQTLSLALSGLRFDRSNVP